MIFIIRLHNYFMICDVIVACSSFFYSLLPNASFLILLGVYSDKFISFHSIVILSIILKCTSASVFPLSSNLLVVTKLGISLDVRLIMY